MTVQHVLVVNACYKELYTTMKIQDFLVRSGENSKPSHCLPWPLHISCFLGLTFNDTVHIHQHNNRNIRNRNVPAEMVRTPCCDKKNGIKKGAWTPEEDRKLIAYVTKYGHWNWRLLPKFAGIRSS